MALVIWLLGWPLTESISSYLSFLSRGNVVRQISPESELVYALFFVAIWVYVAYKVHTTRDRTGEIEPEKVKDEEGGVDETPAPKL